MLKVNIVNLGLAVSVRVYSTWFVWCQERDESFIIAFAPMGDYKLLNGATAEIMNAFNDAAAATEAIRGQIKGFFYVKPLAPEGKRTARPAG